jgi:hypothetical protein
MVLARGRSLVRPTFNSRFERLATGVQQGLMGLLNRGRVVAVDEDGDVALSQRFAAGAAQKADCGRPHLPGCSKSGNYIFALSTRAEHNQTVSGARKGFDLSGEDVFEAEVVGDAGERCWVGVEADRGQGRAICLEAPEQFLGEVKGLSGGSPVSARQEGPTVQNDGLNGHEDTYAVVLDGIQSI